MKRSNPSTYFSLAPPKHCTDTCERHQVGPPGTGHVCHQLDSQLPVAQRARVSDSGSVLGPCISLPGEKPTSPGGIDNQSRSVQKWWSPRTMLQEMERRISATSSGWGCPLLTVIYPGFDCGSGGIDSPKPKPGTSGTTLGRSEPCNPMSNDHISAIQLGETNQGLASFSNQHAKYERKRKHKVDDSTQGGRQGK